MAGMTRRTAAVLALGALGLGALGGSGASASSQVSPDRIVFASNRAENLDPDVFAVGVDGYSRRNLTSTLLASEVHPQVSPDGRRILFQRTFEGDTSIYVMDRDGRNARRVGTGGSETWSPDSARIAYVERTEILVRDVEGGGAAAHVATGFLPSWSPDGSRIAFVRGLGQGHGFFVVRLDGSGERRVASGLTYGGVMTDAPRWSPDGRRLAVQSGEIGGRAHVTVVDVATGDAHQLTPGVHPRWSPDGSLIAFAAQDQRNTPISVIAPDGSGLRALATGPAGPSAADDYPAWSPDGRRLAFVRRVAFPGEQVFVVGVDGTGLRRVTRESSRSRFFQHDGPFWLDDRTVVFSSHLLDNDFDLYSVRSDGVALRRLTDNDVDEREPVWSPDGRTIAYTRGREGGSAIWTINAGGRGARRVSPRAAGSAASPSWSPNGRRLAFVGIYRHAAALYVVNADGTGLRRVRGASAGGTADTRVDWSPDGSRLVYSWEPTPSQLFVLPVRGGRPRKLTPGRQVSDLAPRWSPDGRTIAFVRVSSCGRSCERVALMTMTPDGRRARRLVEHAIDPTWSPDGRGFAFSYQGRIATARSDGSRVRYVTVPRGPQSDRYPDWRR
jgi:Tol biopolymer transport system component